MREDSPAIFFHPGLPKTATTYLQDKVFPYFNDVHFTRKHYFKHHRNIIKNTDCNIFLFSFEHDVTMEQSLQKFSTHYPDAGIILSFRKHDKWIASKYRYYIRKNGYKFFDEYFDLENDNGMLKKKDAVYMGYIKLVEKYFHKRPLIIFQDEMKKDMWSVMDQMAQYIGCTYNKAKIKTRIINRAFNDKQLFYIRLFNRLFKHNSDKFQKRWIRKPHHTSRKYILHVYAFFVNFIPKFLAPAYEIVPKDKLKTIKEFYKNDWEACKSYAKDTMDYLSQDSRNLG